MTHTMTRDSHDGDGVTMTTADNSNVDLENITDANVLQQMLEGSEDLEFRRLVRAQLRKLKKGKQDNGQVSVSAAAKSSVPEQKFLPRNASAVDPKVVASDLRKNQNVSSGSHGPALKTPLAEVNQSPRVLETVKLRSTSTSKCSQDGGSTSSLKLEEVTLRSTPRDALPTLSGDRKSVPHFDVTLKHVTSTIATGVGGSQSSGLPRNKGNPTPRQALKHFKQMDNEALLRNTGAKDTQEALKRISRNLNPSPNNIRDQTLNWCRNRLRGYENVLVEDFSASWSDGLAFCALANSFFPHAFDYDSLTPENRRHNFQLAFDTLEKEAGVVPLLEVDDMLSTRNPDWKCVFTYVNSIIARMSEIRKEKEEEKEEEEARKRRLLLSSR